VVAAHAAEVPARGVDHPLSGDEGTVDHVFEIGVEVAWGEELLYCILWRLVAMSAHSCSRKPIRCRHA
jgi:hypothetical protein